MAGVTFGGSTPNPNIEWDPTTGSFKPKASGTTTGPNAYPAGTAGGAAGNAGQIGQAGNQQAADASKNTGADYSVDSTGGVVYNNSSAEQRQTIDQQAKIAADAAAKQRDFALADRASFMQLLATNPSAVSAPNVAPVSGAMGPQANEADARAAAFARAKDQAGQIARSSLTSIAENMAGRNMTGGGLQSLKEAGAIGGAGDSLQNLTRDQLISDNNRAADVSDENYQGAIAQRGQDVTARGQDLANRASYMSLLRSLY